jgi:hypothetical protein
MLHRETFDTLADTGLVLTWTLVTDDKVDIEQQGGYIVVRNDNVFTIWHQNWKGELKVVDTIQLLNECNDEFALAQSLAKGYLAKHLPVRALTTV